jgi:hypothetical protein
MSGPIIDFAEINRAALAAFPAVLARVLPGGKRVGAEIVALNPRRADRWLGSFKGNRPGGGNFDALEATPPAACQCLALLACGAARSGP